MTGIIAFIGILVICLGIVVSMEFWPLSFNFKKQKSLSKVLDEIDDTEPDPITGLRKTLQPLEAPVQKYAGPKLLKKMKHTLYWGQMGGKKLGWTASQILTQRVVFTVVGVVVAFLISKNLLFVVACGALGWLYPVVSLNGTAKKTSRMFQAQLPEYLQLVNGKMAGGVSFEEAIRRTSRAESLPALWMRRNIQMAQGRDLIAQIMQEAIESQSTELISTASQLENLKYGAKQQELLDRLAIQITNSYTASADLRAEKIGGELVFPMIILYFLPFLVCLIAIIAYPAIQGFF